MSERGGQGGPGGVGGPGGAGKPGRGDGRGGTGGVGGVGGTGGEGGTAPYHPARRTEVALILCAIVVVVALAALVVGGLAYYRQGRDERCFRSNFAHQQQIAAEDRRVQDDLNKHVLDSLVTPSRQTVAQLVAAYRAAQVARTADDKERAEHPITGSC